MKLIKNGRFMCVAVIVSIMMSICPDFGINAEARSVVELESSVSGMPAAVTVYTDDTFENRTITDSSDIESTAGEKTIIPTVSSYYRCEPDGNKYIMLPSWNYTAKTIKTRTTNGQDIDRLTVAFKIANRTTVDTLQVPVRIFDTAHFHLDPYRDSNKLMLQKYDTNEWVSVSGKGTPVINTDNSTTYWHDVAVTLQRVKDAEGNGYTAYFEEIILDGVVFDAFNNGTIPIDTVALKRTNAVNTDWWTTVSGNSMVSLGNCKYEGVCFDDVAVYEPWDGQEDPVENQEQSIWEMYNSAGEPIYNKLMPGDGFSVAAEVPEGETGAVIYCGVYQDGALKCVAKSEGSGSRLECRSSIPEDCTENYYVRAFLIDEKTLKPLHRSFSFDAAGAYESVAAQIGEEWYYSGRELINNPSMEYENAGAPDGWYNRNKGTITSDSINKIDGNYSMKVSNRQSAYSSATQYITDVLKESGTGYYAYAYSCLSPADGVTFSYNLRIEDSKGLTYYINDAGGQVRYGIWNSLKPEAGNTWASTLDIALVTVPEDMVSAYIYVETSSNSAVTDYYLDRFVLRKILTHSEYLAQNTVPDKCTPEPDDYISLIKAYNEQNTVVLYPQSTDEILINPYKGYLYYPSKTINYCDEVMAEGAEFAGVLYSRYAWSVLEPERGKYNFDMVRKNIEFAKSKGLQMAIGVGITINKTSMTVYSQATPLWLFDECGAPYWEEPVTPKDGGADKLLIPIYTDEIFRTEYERFLNAFAEEFNGCEDIAFIDMRSYGNWGEWHFGGALTSETANKATEAYDMSVRKYMVDVFKNFRLPLAMFTNKTEPLIYAMDTLGAGIRVDGIMSPDTPYEHLKMRAADGKNFAAAEWFYSYEKYRPTGSMAAYKAAIPKDFEMSLREGKVSYMSLGNFIPNEFSRDFPDLLRRNANRVGYWFKPAKITYPAELTSGLFTMILKNDGVTQLYAGYDRAPSVKLALADGDGTILKTLTLEGINPEDWKAGKYSYISYEYNLSDVAGAEKLLLGVFSSKNKTSPDIKLGIECAVIDGWYDLSSCTEQTDISDNKLYTASGEYAEKEYGYHEARYAFDGNNETYWATQCRKGEYLSVDFGEEKKVCEIAVKGVQNLDVSYWIEGFDGQYWIPIAKGSSISTAGDKLSFDTAEVSRLRLRIDETKSDELVRISELAVN